jgi:hypothetical protein
VLEEEAVEATEAGPHGARAAVGLRRAEAVRLRVLARLVGVEEGLLHQAPQRGRRAVGRATRRRSTIGHPAASVAGSKAGAARARTHTHPMEQKRTEHRAERSTAARAVNNKSALFMRKANGSFFLPVAVARCHGDD